MIVGTPERQQELVPPYDLDAEEALLGAMLISNDAAATGVDSCREADFHRPAHAHIFNAIVSLFEAGAPIDAITVADQLRKSGTLDEIGDPTFLVELIADTPSSGAAVHYARIVRERARQRRLIGYGRELIEGEGSTASSANSQRACLQRCSPSTAPVGPPQRSAGSSRVVSFSLAAQRTK